MNQEIIIVDIEKIKASSYQPREEEQFDIDQLKKLSQTIKNVGLIHPPTVKKVKDGFYELIAGERRLRAAKLADLKTIPVIIKIANEKTSALSGIIENLQRVNLNPIELAQSFQKTIDEFNLTHDQLAEYLGINRVTLSNQIRILCLPKIIQKAIKESQITLGHAKILAGVKSLENQLSLFQIIVRDHLSVRQTEKKALLLAPKTSKSAAKNNKKTNIFLQQIQENLQKQFGTKVSFNGDENSGHIEMHYYNTSDLNRLLSEIGYEALD